MAVAMVSNRAGTAIIVWAVAILASVALIPVHVFFAGVVVGSLLTAGLLTLVVKWSIEGMLSQSASDIEQMNETLGKQELLPNERE